MSPRNIGNFLKSKFGLFIVFVVVLFSGLAIYAKQQARDRQAAKLAPQAAKKVELGQVKLPLDKGLESGVPQQSSPATGSKPDDVTGGAIVPFRPPPASVAPVAAAPAAPAKAAVGPKPETKPRKAKYVS